MDGSEGRAEASWEKCRSGEHTGKDAGGCRDDVSIFWWALEG